MFENQLLIIIVSSCKFLRHGQFHDHWISEHVGCAFESCLVEAFTKSNICAPGGASCEVSCLNLELASFIQNGTRSSNWKRKTDRASCVSWNTCTHKRLKELFAENAGFCFQYFQIGLMGLMDLGSWKPKLRNSCPIFSPRLIATPCLPLHVLHGSLAIKLQAWDKI